MSATARPLSGEERADWWPHLVAHRALWAAFQAHTDRTAPVVELLPEPA